MHQSVPLAFAHAAQEFGLCNTQPLEPVERLAAVLSQTGLAKADALATVATFGIDALLHAVGGERGLTSLMRAHGHRPDTISRTRKLLHELQVARATTNPANSSWVLFERWADNALHLGSA